MSAVVVSSCVKNVNPCLCSVQGRATSNVVVVFAWSYVWVSFFQVSYLELVLVTLQKINYYCPGS